MEIKEFNKLAHRDQILDCYRSSLVSQIKMVQKQAAVIENLKKENERLKNEIKGIVELCSLI